MLPNQHVADAPFGIRGLIQAVGVVQDPRQSGSRRRELEQRNGLVTGKVPSAPIITQTQSKSILFAITKVFLTTNSR